MKKRNQSMRGIGRKLGRWTTDGDYSFHWFLCIEQFPALFRVGYS